MQESVEKLLDLAFKAEKCGDRIDAIRLYRQIADGNSEHARYAQNCAENLEELGQGQPTYLIGGGSYDNLSAYQLVIQDDIVSLEPFSMKHAKKMMFFTNLLFCVVFGTFLYFATLAENPLWVFVLIAGIGVLTCVGFDLAVYYRFRNAIDRGVIFRYHRKSGLFELPDRGLKFSEGDSIHIECLTARLSAVDFNDPNSELNFVSTAGGETNRWNLLRSIATIRPFGSITSKLAKELPIEVRRV